MTVVCYWLYTVYYSIYNTCHCSDLTHVSIGPYMGQVPPSSLSLGALSVTITFCQSLLVTLTAVIFTFTTLCFTSTGWNHRSQSPLFALWPLTYQCGDSTSHWCPRSPGSQSRVTSVRQLWLLISCVMSLGKCPRLCVCVCVQNNAKAKAILSVACSALQLTLWLLRGYNTAHKIWFAFSYFHNFCNRFSLTLSCSYHFTNCFWDVEGYTWGQNCVGASRFCCESKLNVTFCKCGWTPL